MIPQPGTKSKHPGEVLRAARLKRGWRIQDLAKASGVSKSAISRLERGADGTPWGSFVALASALGVPLAQIAERGES